MQDDFGLAGKTAAGVGANVIVNGHTHEAEASAVAREAKRLGVRSQEVNDAIEQRAR